MKIKYYIASFSGGKDSTAMVLELIKRQEPLNEVLFCDTYKEFPAMYKHISEVKRIIEKAGIKFTELRSQESFDYLMFEHWPKRKKDKLEGLKGYSWPGALSRWCTKALKVNIINRYISKLSKEFNVLQYIGLAADELNRLEKKGNKLKNFIHPLVIWGWDEEKCLNYCYDNGFNWDGLYKLFKRVSCWCCPLQSLEELRNLRTYFPELWNELLDMDSRTWRKFRPDFSVKQLEIRFQLEEERVKEGLCINPKKVEFREALKEKLTDYETAKRLWKRELVEKGVSKI
jgi:3'-phosphoadenosine 5'-phosphosulfate sulfotransferase (PAPS reductase)/FAD synthetase